MADQDLNRHVGIGDEQIRLAVIVDYPAGAQSTGQQYEDSVLPLLSDHDGHLEQRLRTGDGSTEVHLITFGSRAAYESYLADPRRAAFRQQFLDAPLPTRVLEVRPV